MCQWFQAEASKQTGTLASPGFVVPFDQVFLGLLTSETIPP